MSVSAPRSRVYLGGCPVVAALRLGQERNRSDGHRL